MRHTALLLGAVALRTEFCKNITFMLLHYFVPTRYLLRSIQNISHLTQQAFQLLLQVAVLTLECLVFRQRYFQTSFQREQILFLLLARERCRLPVLYHALLLLGQPGLMGERNKNRNTSLKVVFMFCSF